MTRLTPDEELTRALVERLLTDTELITMLFSLVPRVNAEDDRVWSAFVELPEDAALRAALPRLLVEASLVENAYEQPTWAEPVGDVLVTTHSFAPADYKLLASQIDARVRVVIGSTPVSTSRIIAGELVPEGTRVPVRETAFGNAWRFSSQFRGSSVGVLQ